MPSSDNYAAGSPRRTTRLPKPLGWVVVPLVVLAGIFVAYQGIADPELSGSGRTVALTLGLALILSAVAASLGLVNTSGRGRVALVDSGSAVEVRMRARTPLTMLLVGTGFTAFFFAAGLAVGVPGGGVLVWVIGLLFVILIPDSIKAMARRPALTIYADKVDLRGSTTDVSLAWDDVHTIMYEDSDPIRPRANLLGRTTSPSFTAKSSKLIMPLDRKPRRPELPVYLAAFDEPDRLRVSLEHLQRMPAAERASWIGPGAVELLDGTLRR
jgi:hypothetical protein